MTIDRALELAEALLHEQRANPTTLSVRDASAALARIADLRDQRAEQREHDTNYGTPYS